MRKQYNKLFILILTLVLVIGTINISYANDSDDPRFNIISLNEDEFMAGQSYDLVFKLENTSYESAKEVEFALEIPQETPIQLVSQKATVYEKYFYSKQDIEVDFEIQVDYEAEAGIYPLIISATYYNSDDKLCSYDEQVNLQVIENKEPNEIKFELVSSDKIESGSEFTANVTMENLNELDARNIKVTIDNLSSDTITSLSSEIFRFGRIAKNEVYDLAFDLYANIDIESGIYPIELIVEYENEEGTLKTEINTFYLKVDTNVSNNLIIESIINSKDIVYNDGQFNVTVDIMNQGNSIEKDIEVSISQDPDVIPVTQSIILINAIEPGATESVTFQMKATDSADTGNYPLEVTVEYEDGKEILKQYSGIYVSNDDESTTPRIIINKFSLSSDKIFTGDEFRMDFSVLNTSSVKSIKNLKVIISTTTTSTNSSNDTVTESTSILPINQSNSVYIGNLGTQANTEITIPFKVITNAEGKIYSMDIEFEYEDSDGNQYTDSENVNIPIYEKTELTVSDVRIGTELDNAFTLEVDFYNTGKVDISNMMVDIEGDFATANSNYYVGDFSTGRTDVYDVQIQGSVPNDIEGTIVFTYDDTFGEPVEYRQDFTIDTSGGNQGSKMKGTVPAMSELEEMDREEIQAKLASGELSQEDLQAMRNGKTGIQESNNTILIIVIVLVVIAIGGTVFLVIRKKRNRK